jgi:hypothetical protein
MTQNLRQRNLFAGEDWQTIYQAFTALNFAAYDYDTVRQALIDYIRVNYPEDFNDWIESSEFVAIIEMLAYLAGTLAFRIDLNTRENFLDTATRRESVFRLARQLSYSPRRCLAAQGLLKLQSVRTSQPIFDSNGTNLANQTISWNDPNNPDWFEQFVLVLNASFQPSNPFGVPIKRARLGGVLSERYDLNNTDSSTLAYSFGATVSGTRMNFEMCNTDFDTGSNNGLLGTPGGYYREKTPNIFNSWSLVYRVDGNGNASANTGFFVMFKQGTLAYTDYLLESPTPNRTIDLPAENINQNDVWVQSVDNSGLPTLDWTKVPAIFGSNIAYNDVNRLTRDIFQVITRDVGGSDAVSLRFGDGNFGNIPTGRLRAYHRVSNNLTYNIQPQDISGQGLSLSYQSQLGSVSTLSMTFGLTYTVNNSLSRESTDSIKQRAPAVYYTQNRMVNGEDYNLFPLQNSQALKIKAVNRVYSGHSRYLDINDPTGAYSNTKVFSDDGIIYQEPSLRTVEVSQSQNLNTDQLIFSVLQPLLNGNRSTSSVDPALRSFYLANFPKKVFSSVWLASDGAATNTAQGRFDNIILPDLSKGLTVGSLVAFGDVPSRGIYQKWATIVNAGSSQLGTFGVIISNPVTTGTPVRAAIPPLRTVLDDAERNSVSSAILSKKNFGMRYDQSSLTWRIVDTQDLAVNAPFSLNNQGNTGKTNSDASWLVQFLYQQASGWQISMRVLDHVFESVSDVKFYFVNKQAVISSSTLTKERDEIRILKFNDDAVGSALGRDQRWGISSEQVSADLYREPRSVRVDFWDNNNDGLIDDPQEFDRLVSSTDLVFWKKVDQFGSVTWQLTSVAGVYPTLFSLPLAADVDFDQGSVVYVRDPGIFVMLVDQPSPSWKDVSSSYQARRGRSQINYCWLHYASSERRIDPAVTNIVDVFVLTNSYDTSVRNWISRGRDTVPQPNPPSAEDLAATFAEFDRYKMMSDQIIWHPIRYKLLFGAGAEPDVQAIFKVVKLPGSGITDSEIKSRVVQAINEYFDISNWDFGQSFFFTELAAYIHQRMPTVLSTVVIVPANNNQQFGNLFEITSEPDQLFLSAARVNDVQIVPNLNPAELRINR